MKEQALEKQNIDKKDQESKTTSVKISRKITPKFRSKNYRKFSEGLEKSKHYEISEAVKIIKEHKLKFTPSIEMHIKLGIDPKQADQQIRTNIVLPKSLPKKLNIAVIAKPELESLAKQAGADQYNTEAIIEKLNKGVIDFDILIATPDQMLKLGKFAKILGPKGLMPSPKSGTVTSEIEKAITEIRAGKIEVRNDSYGIVHLAIGKADFSVEELVENSKEFFRSILNIKPSGSKGEYIKSVYIASTMSPSIAVAISSLK